MHVLFSSSLFVIGIFILVIFLLGKGKILAFKILALHIFVLLSVLLFGILLKTKLIYEYPHFFRANAPLGYLLGPIHFFFVRSLLNKESKFRKWDFIHLLPFVLHLIELLPFYSSSSDVKIQLINVIDNNNVINFIELKEGILKAKWHSGLKFTSYFFYLIYSFKIYRDFNQSVSQFIKVENQRLIYFVHQLLQIRTLGFLLMIVALLLNRINPSVSFFFLDLSTTVVLISILFLLVRNPDLLYGMQYSLAYKADYETMDKKYQLNNKLISGYENSPYESSLFIDLEYKIIYFNKNLEDKIKSGFGKQIKFGDDIKSYLSVKTAPLFFKGYTRAIEGNANKIESYISISEKVKESWWEFNFNPIYDESKILFGVTLTTKDISKQKNLEAQITEYKNHLKDVAWRESHLLRAPVSNILGISNLLLKPESSLGIHEKLDLVRHINAEVEKLDGVIHQIVSSSSDLSNNI